MYGVFNSVTGYQIAQFVNRDGAIAYAKRCNFTTHIIKTNGAIAGIQLFLKGKDGFSLLSIFNSATDAIDYRDKIRQLGLTCVSLRKESDNYQVV